VSRSEGHHFAPSKRIRRGRSAPELWISAAPTYGRQLAAHFGLPYAFAYFFTECRGTEERCVFIQNNYRPSAFATHRRTRTICVWHGCDTEEKRAFVAYARALACWFERAA